MDAIAEQRSSLSVTVKRIRDLDLTLKPQWAYWEITGDIGVRIRWESGKKRLFCERNLAFRKATFPRLWGRGGCNPAKFPLPTRTTEYISAWLPLCIGKALNYGRFVGIKTYPNTCETPGVTEEPTQTLRNRQSGREIHFSAGGTRKCPLLVLKRHGGRLPRSGSINTQFLVSFYDGFVK